MHNTSLMTREEVSAFLDREFPQIHASGRLYSVDAVGPMSARMRCLWHEQNVRPGGTISGPTLMALADYAFYIAILAQIGPVEMAVTTNLSFNFMRKAGRADLIADCRLLKLGKRLAVGEVSITSDGSPEIVCHATGTYSIPAT